MILEGGQGTKQIAKSIDAMYLEWHIITKDKRLSSPASNPTPSHPQFSQQFPLRFLCPSAFDITSRTAGRATGMALNLATNAMKNPGA
jgi:hypothetical protein